VRAGIALQNLNFTRSQLSGVLIDKSLARLRPMIFCSSTRRDATLDTSRNAEVNLSPHVWKRDIITMPTKKSPMQKRWEEAHETPRFRPVYPLDQVVRWTFRNLDRTATPKPKVLDLGCGAGRHALFFAEAGFDAYASDISEVGVRELQVVAAKRNVVVQTHATPGQDLSHYENGTFDAVLCCGVMYYLTLAEAEQMMSEVLRVLRPGGKFCLITRTDRDGRCQQATPVGPCTWHLHALGPGAPSNMEEDMDMLFFSNAEIERMFSSFANVCVDRMTYVHAGFANDDWVVSASKP
jgi:SAM-dependent methyltransferase